MSWNMDTCAEFAEFSIYQPNADMGDSLEVWATFVSMPFKRKRQHFSLRNVEGDILLLCSAIEIWGTCHLVIPPTHQGLTPMLSVKTPTLLVAIVPPCSQSSKVWNLHSFTFVSLRPKPGTHSPPMLKIVKPLCACEKYLKQYLIVKYHY